MSTKVYTFGCRISRESRDIVEREIERGRRYYNAMIEAVNLDIAGDSDWSPEKEERLGRAERKSKARRIESLARVICADNAKAKTVTARAIYRRISRVSRNVRADKRFSAASSGCYRGTYHSVQAAFDQSMSSKRVGVWPGDPYRFRRSGDNSGAIVGVHLQPSQPWGKLLGESSSICAPEQHDGRRFRLLLKVSKEAQPIEVSVDLGSKCRGIRREVPVDALVSHVMLARRGDYGTRGKYVLLVTAKTEAVEVPEDTTQRVGVDVGFAMQDDGSLLVAVTSDGDELRIPPYAVRMAHRVHALQAERDDLANSKRAEVTGCTGKSAIGVSVWCEKNGTGHAEYLDREHSLRCTQDHVRRRYQAIRLDAYRKFASALGAHSYVKKVKLKAVAEKELRGEELNLDRVIASCFELESLLRQRGAVDVVCEIEGDAHGPSVLSARKIKEAGEAGSLKIGTARKQVRKYRKSKAA